jgi:hypothetical protein
MRWLPSSTRLWSIFMAVIPTHKDFLDIFNRISPSKHRYTVFTDFVTMFAIWVHLNKRQKSSVGFYAKPTTPRLSIDFRPPIFTLV